MQNSGSVNPISGGHLGSAPSWNALGPSVGVTISKPQTPQTSSSGSMSLPHPGTLGSSGTIRQPNKEGKQYISQIQAPFCRPFQSRRTNNQAKFWLLFTCNWVSSSRWTLSTKFSWLLTRLRIKHYWIMILDVFHDVLWHWIKCQGTICH